MLSPGHAAAREHAEELMATGGTKYGLSTDSKRGSGTVLLGVAIAGVGSCLIAIDAGEYSGFKVIEQLEKAR